ncbi:MAG: hypothetical protein ACI8RD_002483 [Bacillariaceae sp.]|jgi:hypothetical protein
MKPAWDQLGDEFAGSSSVVIGDADCTASGEELCQTFGIKGCKYVLSINKRFYLLFTIHTQINCDILFSVIFIVTMSINSKLKLMFAIYDFLCIM